MGTVTLETEAVLVEQAKTDEQAFRRLYEQHRLVCTDTPITA